MKTYRMVAGNSGYEVVLTYKQAEHMLSLWGDQYDISDCTATNPVSSPSGYTRIELISEVQRKVV